MAKEMIALGKGQAKFDGDGNLVITDRAVLDKLKARGSRNVADDEGVSVGVSVGID